MKTAHFAILAALLHTAQAARVLHSSSRASLARSLLNGTAGARRAASLQGSTLRGRYKVLELQQTGASARWFPWSTRHRGVAERPIGTFPWGGNESALGRERFAGPSRLGMGNFGDTWRAYDLQRKREVALKIFHVGERYVRRADMEASWQTWRAVKNAEEECRLLQRLQAAETAFPEGKAHICKCVDSHAEDMAAADDVAFLVLELCGRSLQVDEKQPLEKVRKWVRGVLQALRFMSSLATPVQHLDIKLDNVVVGADGEARLIDFGQAGPYNGTRKELYCRLAPPEHWCQGGPVEKYGKEEAWQYDVWTLGGLYYDLLCRPGVDFDSEHVERQRLITGAVQHCMDAWGQELPSGRGEPRDWAVVEQALAEQQDRSSPGELLALLP